jgi:hypothetical protein
MAQQYVNGIETKRRLKEKRARRKNVAHDLHRLFVFECMDSKSTPVGQTGAHDDVFLWWLLVVGEKKQSMSKEVVMVKFLTK